ncbi:TetR/AcrR family transcriptional regulator [Saccharothrix australiensis]|uniref:TetR family transcriptional regulator n=1 Tax=Saccharothrix australiensis TaxID=2072 RepID=A0A495W1K1_9PSEU|nr:TetR/AcrR family transcriptional regulator [Saccharothrix australiensis]RKT55506.1 TetR family transcriptional regulator [Saccharothrix australiensis]
MAVEGVGPAPRRRAERRDSIRNRQAVLAAARRLICDRGLEHVSMQDIAAEAGVGKGTPFRHFGDRQGLLAALFDQLTEDWQPGALARLTTPDRPAAERVRNFMGELFDVVVVSGRPLLRVLEGGHANARGTARYLAWHAALTPVVAEARPDLDARFIAHAVLTTPRAEFVDMLVDGGGMTMDEVRAGLLAMTDALLRSPSA